ncbi:hypothetical protein C8R45DRAFT_1220900 [Mycena sanguinolenta]|nr:hypothetical protein C8R45DRAFT_1220900 [Mycena sanguinolenta]
MAPTSTIPASPAASTPTPTPTPTFVNPLDTGYVGPAVPIWVGGIFAFLVLEAKIHEGKSIAGWKEKLTKLELSGSDLDSESGWQQSASTVYCAEIKDSVAPPPRALADTRTRSVPGPIFEFPCSERMTRANTTKNERRGVQVFVKPPPAPPTVEVDADAYGDSEAFKLPPILRPAGARW